jgi:hypothetical protein
MRWTRSGDRGGDRRAFGPSGRRIDFGPFAGRTSCRGPRAILIAWGGRLHPSPLSRRPAPAGSSAAWPTPGAHGGLPPWGGTRFLVLLAASNVRAFARLPAERLRPLLTAAPRSPGVPMVACRHGVATRLATSSAPNPRPKVQPTGQASRGKPDRLPPGSSRDPDRVGWAASPAGSTVRALASAACWPRLFQRSDDWPPGQSWPWTSRSSARSSALHSLIAGSWPCARGLAPHCPQTPPRDDALVLR